MTPVNPLTTATDITTIGSTQTLITLSLWLQADIPGIVVARSISLLVFGFSRCSPICIFH